MSSLRTRILAMDASAIATSYAVPASLQSGLSGLWFLGGTLQASRRDMSGNGADAVFMGVPVIGKGSVSLVSNQAYLRTQVPESASWSHVVVAASSLGAGPYNTTNTPVLVSNYDGNRGASTIYKAAADAYPAGNLEAVCWHNSGTPTANAAPNEVLQSTIFALLMTTYDDTTGRTAAYDITHGTSAVDTSAPPGVRSYGAGRMLIGSDAAGVTTGASQIAFVALYNRALSPTDGLAWKAAIASYLLARGITI